MKMTGRILARGAAGLAIAAVLLLGVASPSADAAEAPFVGMQIQGLSPEAVAALGLGDAAGVLIRDVALGGPADQAGFRRGDLIVEFAGMPVQSLEHLVSLVGALAPGAAADAVVQRDGGTRVKLSLKTSTWPEAWREGPDKFAALPNLGLTFAAITAKVRQQFGLRWGSTGLVVTLVDEAKVSAVGRLIDLKRGEVIVQVNQKAVWQPDQLLAAYAEAKKAGRTSLLLLVEGSEGGGRNGFRLSLLPVQ